MIAPRSSFSIPLAHGRVLELGARTLVMGVLNVTPDSFADSVRYRGDAAIDAALRMEAEGADLIDVGGESTRPGSAPVPADEELRRVLPVVEALAPRLRVPISIDTYKASVAGACLSAGASLVNDVSSLRLDPGLTGAVEAHGAALILMHSRGRFDQMYAQAQYADPVAEVAAELAETVTRATAAGVARERLVLDPGIGFAKRAAHSYGLLARLDELATRLDRPLLVGVSRKSFMNDALGDRPAIERDWGTAAAVSAAVLGGAHLVRVHAVKEMLQVVRVADRIRQNAVQMPTDGLDR
jgi:dihydropteroate synthase